MEWISVEERLPDYGWPVLIKVHGVTQNITYIRDGADDVPDWFEPYFFEHTGELRLYCHTAESWAYLPK